MARAERLSGAEKREARAEAGFARASELASVIPFGQPILVGHHSEGRDRRYRDRIDATGQRALEDSRMAESMRSRAANIEAAADRAIYSDDPDAVGMLRARLVELEARRDAIKAENAAFRKAHRAESVGLSAYGRDQLMPHPGYELTNLSGNIKRNRDRLAGLLAARS